MNIIVAILLITLHDVRLKKNTKKSFGKESVTDEDIEEWVFWLLVYIMEEKSHYKMY